MKFRQKLDASRTRICSWAAGRTGRDSDRRIGRRYTWAVGRTGRGRDRGIGRRLRWAAGRTPSLVHAYICWIWWIFRIFIFQHYLGRLLTHFFNLRKVILAPIFRRVKFTWLKQIQKILAVRTVRSRWNSGNGSGLIGWAVGRLGSRRPSRRWSGPRRW